MAPDNGLAVAALNELSEAVVLSGTSHLLKEVLRCASGLRLRTTTCGRLAQTVRARSLVGPSCCPVTSGILPALPDLCSPRADPLAVNHPVVYANDAFFRLTGGRAAAP